MATSIHVEPSNPEPLLAEPNMTEKLLRYPPGRSSGAPRNYVGSEAAVEVDRDRDLTGGRIDVIVRVRQGRIFCFRAFKEHCWMTEMGR